MRLLDSVLGMEAEKEKPEGTDSKILRFPIALHPS
jgi:hypothetical protein